jgi:streptogramin lyase
MDVALAPLATIMAIASAATVIGGLQLTSPGAGPAPDHPGAAVPVTALDSFAIPVGAVPTDVVATPRATWVSTSLGEIARVDPTTNERVARIDVGGSLVALEHGLGALWAIDVFESRLLRIDPMTDRVVREIPVDPLPSGLALGHGLVWVESQLESTVAGIDPGTGAVVKLARFARGELWPGGLAVGPAGVWVITGAGNEVSLFDPATMRFRYRMPVAGARTVVAAGRSAWIGLAAARSVVRIHDGRVSRFDIGARAGGYGPLLAVGEHLWVVSGATLVTIALDTGAIEGRLHLDGRVALAALSLGDDPWAVDVEQRALVRLRPSGGGYALPVARASR